MQKHLKTSALASGAPNGNELEAVAMGWTFAFRYTIAEQLARLRFLNRTPLQVTRATKDNLKSKMRVSHAIVNSKSTARHASMSERAFLNYYAA